jgi:hypothetical protein
MSEVDVACHAAGSDWRCDVTVDASGRRYRHQVDVRAGDLVRLDPDAADPVDLVRRSFAFLLEREPPSSILGSFDLLVIARYFPEYEQKIRRHG